MLRSVCPARSFLYNISLCSIHGLSGLLRLSQRRWVTISGTMMSFYNKIADKQPCSQLNLTDYMPRALESSKSPSNKPEACFELVSPGKKTYQYVAGDVHEMNLWVQAIQRAVRSPPPPSNDPKGDDQPKAPLHHEKISLGDQQVKDEVQEDEEAMYEVVGESGAVWAVPAVVREYEYFADETTQVTEPKKAVAQEGNPADWYIGLWDCVSDDPTELDFYRGDLIYVVSRAYDQYLWWVAAKDGKVGLVPKNYLSEAFERVS